MKISCHTALEANELFGLGWFPDQLTDQGREAATKLSAIEARVDGLAKSEREYDDGLKRIRTLVARLADSDVTSTYLTLVEYKPAPRNRVRSYKGLFPKPGRIRSSGGFVLEDEADVSPTTSLLVGAAEILKGNVDEAFSLCQDFLRAFFLVSRTPLGTDDWPEILRRLRESLDLKGSVRIDYMKLIPVLCSDDLALFTVATDTRADVVNVRVFLGNAMVSLVQGEIAKSLAEL